MNTNNTNFNLDSEDDQGIGWLLSDITRMAAAEFNRRTRDQNLPLSRAQWRILLRLNRNDGQAQTELADNMGMEKAPLGIIVDKMEAAGLVERRPDPKDGRVRRVHITPTAAELSPLIDDISTQLVEDMLAGLSQMRRLQLSQSLNHIKQNLRNSKQGQ